MKPLLSIVLALALLQAAVAGQSGNDLFQKALSKERVDGQLTEAIALYERIVRGFASDRALAAKSLLQMGQCYERLGKTDAQSTYERVVREFADQRAAADEARVRLAALALSDARRTNGPATRQIMSPSNVGAESVSADGRFLSFTDWDTGDLAIHELAVGTTRRLTAKGSWNQSPDFAEYSVISPDGTAVVYTWCGKNGCDLRIVSVRGGPPRVLYRHEEVSYPWAFEWSPDGKRIVAAFERADKTHQLVIVSAADGTVRVLKTLDWRSPWKMSFSPDGAYVAYDFPPVLDAPERDVFMLAVDGSREVPLVSHPAHDVLLGWMPRSDRVLFASDRRGTNAAWTIRVDAGRPRGEPVLVKPSIGHVLAKNFTKAGDYYYALSTGLRNIQTAGLNPETGTLSDALAPLKGRFEQGRLAAQWSPQGNEIAYLVQSPLVRGGEGANTLAIQDLATGQVRELPLPLNYANRLRWQPDGRAIVIGGTDLKGRWGLFRVELRSGRVEPIVAGADPIGRFAISPDVRTIFYERRGQTAAIVARDLAHESERELYRVSGSGLALSPDGQWLAIKPNLLSADGTISAAPSIQLLPAAGGTPRTIVALAEPDSSDWRELAWSADGRFIFFTKSHGELWRIAAAGGEPTLLARDLKFINSISVHPDGRRLAISEGSAKYELWALENLIPPSRRTAPPARR